MQQRDAPCPAGWRERAAEPVSSLVFAIRSRQTVSSGQAAAESRSSASSAAGDDPEIPAGAGAALITPAWGRATALHGSGGDGGR